MTTFFVLSFYCLNFFFNIICPMVFTFFMFFMIFFSFYSSYVGPFLVFDTFTFFLLFMTLIIFSSCFVLLTGDYYSFNLCFSMFAFMFLSFVSNSFLMFFVFFEIVFFLMFVFLYSKGSHMERAQASFYMLFYTLLVSLPFFLCILFYTMNSSTSFFSFNFLQSFDYFWVFAVLIFCIKLPIYGLHLWLPKAHVQASVEGSMILAGVLLKLGGYGLYRFFSMMDVNFFSSLFYDVFLYMGVWGGLVVCMLCVRQSDLKMLIAYSSICHMSTMFLGLMSFSFLGLGGSVLMLSAHGYISPVMFFLMTFIYFSFGSRSIFILKGMSLVCPIFLFFWFFSSFTNLGIPPFMSFFSEAIIFGSLNFSNFFSFIMVFFCLFFTGVYCVYCYTIPSHGKTSVEIFSVMDLRMMFISFYCMFTVIMYPFLNL